MTRNVARNRSPFSIWLAVISLCTAGLVGTYVLFVEAPPPRRIVIATGGKDGAYYRFAQLYANLLKSEGITLEVRSTQGSVENLKLLMDDDSDVRVAFVQTGIANSEECDSLEALASLYREPLWIFYRGSKGIDRLTQLKQQRIAIGPEGSGTRGIALQLLKANGLGEKDDEFSALAGNLAAEALERGEIDVAFFVAGVDAKYVRKLLRDPEIHLAELTHAEAYERQFRFLSAVKIDEGLLDLQQNIPSHQIVLIAPAATLVAHRSLHPALVSLLLKVATKVHQQGDLLSNVGEFPSPKLTDLPLNPEAERYFRSGPPVLQRFMPFWLASMLDRLKIMIIPLIMLLMPLMRVAPPLVRWQTRRKIYLWYDELRRIDLRSIDGMTIEEADSSLEHLHRLEQQIARIGVPLSYMEEYYNLRLHLNLVRSRVLSILRGEAGHSQPGSHPGFRTEGGESTLAR